MATKKEMMAELRILKAKQRKLEGNDKQRPENTSVFGGIVARDNVENTEKYDSRYTLLHFVDEDGEKLAQVRGNEAAEEALVLVKAIKYGTQGKGSARWNKQSKAWSLLESEITEEVRSLFVESDEIKGNYTA